MDAYTQMKSIEDAIATILIANPIDGVNGIVMDKELKQGNTNPPYIKVFLDDSPVDGITLNMGELWYYRFTIMVVADSYASTEASQHKRIALQISSLLLQSTNRRLNDTVEDTIRRVWSPDYKKELPSGQLFGSAVTMEARFKLDNL